MRLLLTKHVLLFIGEALSEILTEMVPEILKNEVGHGADQTCFGIIRT
jgi:hypothetical protein